MKIGNNTPMDMGMDVDTQFALVYPEHYICVAISFVIRLNRTERRFVFI